VGARDSRELSAQAADDLVGRWPFALFSGLRGDEHAPGCWSALPPPPPAAAGEGPSRCRRPGHCRSVLGDPALASRFID